MAKETITKLTDDIDGSEAAESVTFSLRGVDYEIDLSQKNLAGLEKAFAKWVDAGREVAAAEKTAPARRARKRPARRAAVSKDASVIREWAKSNGYEVSARGRIPASLQEAFAAANS
jgi:Lsr2